MKSALHIVFSLFIFSNFGLCQSPEHWTAIDNEDISYQPGRLVYSENLHQLIYTGYFLRESGSKYIAGYNGDEWEVFIDSTSGIATLVDFEEGVLVAGQTIPIENQSIPHIAYFDGEAWSFPWEFNAFVRKLVWLNDTLYALGNFTEIDGVPVHHVARLVGNEWEGVYTPSSGVSFTIFNDMAYYQGDIYIGGNFQQEGGPNDFAILRNGNLEHVGDETLSIGTIEDLEVYQDELYVGGAINYTESSPYHLLFRWNGTEFNTVGPYMHYIEGVLFGGRIQFLKVKDGYLYAGGGFKYIGDDEIAYVARWDGSEWCGLYGEEHVQDDLEFQQFFAGMDFYEDQLVIMKAYVYDDGDYDAFWIYDGGDEVSICTEPLSVNDLDGNDVAFNLYPNPAQNQITLQCDEQIVRVEMLDVSGRVVQASGALPKNGLIEIGSLPSGIYLVKVETADGGLGLRKLVLE